MDMIFLVVGQSCGQINLKKLNLFEYQMVKF